jgi:hypothetical protein
MTDDELSGYNNYSFSGKTESPVKFCHYYKEYKQCFIQSAVSFEYDYVGRNSSIAHTLVLSEAESRRILEDHICPFSPAMFMNSKSDSFERPKTGTLPELDYRFLKCGDREYNKNVITKFFRSEVFAQFVLSIFLSAENGYSIFIALPGAPREASLNAIRLMNVITPAFPSEYRKKMGFMTYVTDTYALEDVSIYFVSGMDLSRKFVNSAYCFDLTKDKPYVSGFEPSTVKEYQELIRTVIGNILSYDNEGLNAYYNDILPKLDSYGRFDLQKINEIFFMWKFLSGSAETAELDGKDACRVLSSFYSFYGIVDNKAAFLNRINGFWEKEIEKCRGGGYAPDIEVFDIVNKNYPSFGEDDKRQAQRIWSFALIYTVSNNDMTLFDKLFTFRYSGSDLVADVISYVVNIYVGFLYRRDKNAKMGEAYSKIVGGYIGSAAESSDASALFGVLGNVIRATDKFYDEMGYDKKDQYELFSASFIPCFEEPVAMRFRDAGLSRKFTVIEELKKYTYLIGDGGESSLGRTVYEHFHSSAFLPGVISGFTNESISRMADDRKLVTDLSHELENFHELENVDIISLFQRYCGLICGSKDISVLYELDDLVNKPEQQDMLKNWVGIYTKKFPDIMLSLFANSSCMIDGKGNMVHSVDYIAAFRQHFDNIGHEREQMMRELNRLIPDLETDSTRTEYKDLGLAAYREPTAHFINDRFFDKSIDRKTLKDNESMLKRFDKVKSLREYADPKKQKHKRFGK